VEQLTNPQHELRAVVDRAAIADLVVRCAQAQDRKDWDAVGATYLPDAEYVHPGGRLVGREAIVERTRAALEILDTSQHLLGSFVVTVDGDAATSVCYFHAQHVREAAPGGPLYAIAGTYSDSLVRSLQGWRIAGREQTYQWRSGNREVVAR
jgi:uncharacterized protein (TIGR02246 family)